MNTIDVIDLHFQSEESIASFLIPSSDGLILIESGPESTWKHLENGITALGHEVEDIKHVFLTHIHFDHAGAAWKLAEHGATIYVHPIGLPHMANPEKLWNSASQIYGDDMDRLWGKMQPIPANQLKAVDEGDEITIGEHTIKVWYTPGHAIHHNAYQIEDIIFTGDVAGVRIENGPVQPPCPPPDINLELWLQSIDKLKKLNPSALYLTHFAKQDNPIALLEELELHLHSWANWIKPYFEAKTPIADVTPEFVAFTRKELENAGLNEHEIKRYEYANPSFMSVTGLYRYWKLKSEGRI
jgi:glyoxylase-like metal-dependent hydrolase (beta-lactamase superfamily II)